MNLLQGFYNPLHIVRIQLYIIVFNTKYEQLFLMNTYIFIQEPIVDVFTTYPQPTSLKSVKHYLQLLISGKYQVNNDYNNINILNNIYLNTVIISQLKTSVHICLQTCLKKCKPVINTICIYLLNSNRKQISFLH